MDIFWPDFEFLRNSICIAEAKHHHFSFKNN